MEFIRKHWATLILVGIAAAYLGISLGTNSCPLCVIAESVNPPAETSGTVVSAKNDDSTATPQWSTTFLDGTEVSSKTLEGKIGVLVYWATWCAPCREEIPDLIELRQQFNPKEVSIIGVSVDSPGKDLPPFIEARGINYDIARHNESLEEAFGPVRYIPTMFIIDKDGTVAYQHTGIVGKSAIRSQINALLSDASKA